MLNISRRTQNLKPSATLAVVKRAAELKAEGRKIIDFGAGQPDFDTPSRIRKGAAAAIEAGHTRYTPAAGAAELKKAIQAKFKKDNGLVYSPEEIIVSNGAKHSIYNCLMATIDPGDEVIIVAPYWVSYPEMVRLAGGNPRVVRTTAAEGYRLDPKKFARAISRKTKAAIINSPSNPTGVVYPPEDLKALARIALEREIFVISDEIYEKLLYAGKHLSFAAATPGAQAITLTVNGVSKMYAMTGWRIGYTAGPIEVIRAMTRLQEHSTSNASSVSQQAAREALKKLDMQPKMLRAFTERRAYMHRQLKGMKDVVCPRPDGAFYCFPDISGYFGKRIGRVEIKDSLDFAGLLLETKGVAVVPGAAFGDDHCVRLSYATSLKNIVKGLDLIKKFLKEAK